MIRLVVNAQELGTSEDSDLAILKAHRDGIVTSASLLGNGPFPRATRERLLEAPHLGVGLSLVLVGGLPICSAQEIPSLISSTSGLRTTPTAFAVDWLRDEIVALDVEREIEAQVTRALDAGFTLDHLCTRNHLGFLPGVGQIVERVARRHKIPGIRSTVEPPTLSWLTDPRRGLQTGLMAGFSWLARKRLGPLRHGPRTWGYLESGRLDEVRIIEIIGRLAPGPHELICHPSDAASAPADAAAEFRALTSTKVKTALQRRGIVLCRWRDLF